MVQFFYDLKLNLGIGTVSCFATDGKYGHGLKIETVGPSCLCLMLCLQKSPKYVLWFVLPDEIV